MFGTRKLEGKVSQVSLPSDSTGAAVAILKASTTLDAHTRNGLTPQRVRGVIYAEARRIGFGEWLGEKILPVDISPSIPVLGRLGPLARKLHGYTGGQGPGQLYVAAYNAVRSQLKLELSQFLAHMGTNHSNAGPHRPPLILKGYPWDVIDPVTADFFIAGYLALRVKDAKKPGRPVDDQWQIGIGLYFGAYQSIFDAQNAISPQDKGASVLTYPPIKAWLQRSSQQRHRDTAAYIEEVFRNRI
jgi:hypothetical protein